MSKNPKHWLVSASQIGVLTIYITLILVFLTLVEFGWTQISKFKLTTVATCNFSLFDGNETGNLNLI